MRHFTEGELLDLAEGEHPDVSAGHLASCEACRRQLMDLRSAMTMAAAVDVPEPSPLFWEHLSARVREAVAAEDRPPEVHWLRNWTAWRAMVTAGALTVLVLTAAVMLRPAPDSSTASIAAGGSELRDNATTAVGDFDPAEDSSLTLLADLTSDLDWDAASEAGLAPRAGAVDDVVTSLSSGERRELQRLLQEALRPSGV